MVKGSNKQRKSAQKSTKVQTKDHVFREEDLDDEIDAFHKQRDVIPLDLNDDDAGSDEEMEQAVFDLEDGDEDSDDIKGDEDDNEDDKDIRPRGFAAKMARQAKYLQQKFGAVDVEMDDGNDDEEEDQENKSVWGRKKDFYYGSDSGDEGEESDEDLTLEEAEALKIQKEMAKSLSMEDFGLEDVVGADSDSDKLNRTFQDTFAGKKSARKHNVDALAEDIPFESCEVVREDLNALSREEQMEVVKSSAPEVLGLLAELDKAQSQLKQLKPLLAEALKEKKGTTNGAMSFLEVKQIVLLTYCQAITFSLLLKSEGQSMQDHPVVARLVEIHNLLEKMEQISENIPSQVEEIANVMADARVVHDQESAPLEFEPMVKGDVIKQHHVTAVKESQLVKDHISKDLVSENVSRNIQDAHVGLQSMEMLKIRANIEAKLKKKGIYNSSNSNPGRAQHHAQMLANQRLETLDDFDDEVQQTAKQHHESNGDTTLLHFSKPIKVKKQKIISGDDDLPKRDDIGERRRKFELRVLARTGTKSTDGVGNDDVEVEEDDGEGAEANGIAEEDGEFEDEFYKEVKKQRADKLKAKAQLYNRAPAIVNPALELDADGKRQISVQMEKNRGLTRSRKKSLKNPRKKYRLKHDQSVKKRKGQVRDIRKPTGSYGGEATGININVSRSRRFNN